MARTGILSTKTVAIAGDFGAKRSHQDLKRWIEANGGNYATGISSQVTHLVCSKLQWKQKMPLVKAALAQKKTQIVSYDWLEDSLISRRLQSECKYLMDTVITTARTKKEAQKSADKQILKDEGNVHSCATTNQIATSTKTNAKADLGLGSTGKKFQEGRRNAQIDLLSENYMYYRDTTMFLYNVTLSRIDISQNRNERHQLRLYRSISQPYLYATTATYLTPGRGPERHILAPVGSQYHVAFAAWRRFFRSATGIEWDFRVWGMLSARETARKALLEGVKGEDIVPGMRPDSTSSMRSRYFSYAFPETALGEPVGDMGLDEEGTRKYGGIRPTAVPRVVGGGALPDQEQKK